MQGINIYRLYSYFTAIVALKHGHWLRHGVAGVAHSCSLKHFLGKVVLTKQSKMVIGRHRMDTEWYNTLQIKKFLIDSIIYHPYIMQCVLTPV